MSAYNGPINPNPVEGESRIIIYGYVPSLALGIVGAATFAIILLANIWYIATAARKKAEWRAAGGVRKGLISFHSLLAFGSLMECVGYACRIYSHYRPFLVVLFIIQYFMIVVAPVLFTASIYLSLSLLVRGFGKGAERLLVLPPRLVLAIFVTADAITTVVQVAGAALIGVSESAVAREEKPPLTPATANNILLAGLAVQTFSFLIFLSILAVAIYRAHHTAILEEAKAEVHTASAPESTAPREADPHGFQRHFNDRALKRMLWVILGTSDLILLRTVFRLAETAQGLFSFASTHEYLFGILEYTPVIVALSCWCISPPSKFISVAFRGISNTTGAGRVGVGDGEIQAEKVTGKEKDENAEGTERRRFDGPEPLRENVSASGPGRVYGDGGRQELGSGSEQEQQQATPNRQWH